MCVNACRAPWAPGRHLDTVQSNPGYSHSALSGSAVCYPIHAAVCCIYVCMPGYGCVSVWRRALTHTRSLHSAYAIVCLYVCVSFVGVRCQRRRKIQQKIKHGGEYKKKRIKLT